MEEDKEEYEESKAVAKDLENYYEQKLRKQEDEHEIQIV